jgi:hypothetical protein
MAEKSDLSLSLSKAARRRSERFAEHLAIPAHHPPAFGSRIAVTE